MNTPATPLIDDLFAAVRAWNPRPPWQPPESIAQNKAGWEAETAAAGNSPETLNAILARHLTPSEDTDKNLAESLDRAQLIGGDHRVAKKFISALVHAYLAAISPARRENVVRLITSKRSEIGMREGWLEQSICEFGFTADFLRAWLLEILPADGGSSAYWPLVRRLAREQRPHDEPTTIVKRIESFVDQTRSKHPFTIQQGIPFPVLALGCIKTRSPLPSEYWRHLVFRKNVPPEPSPTEHTNGRE